MTAAEILRRLVNEGYISHQCTGGMSSGIGFMFGFQCDCLAGQVASVLKDEDAA